jgi:hypothetical protein
MAPAETTQVEQQALAIRDEATVIALSVQNSTSYEAAVAWLQDVVKPLRALINETFDPIIKAAHESHKVALAAKAKVEAGPATAENVVKLALSGYTKRLLLAEKEANERALAEARKAEEDRRLAQAAELELLGRGEQAQALLDKPIIVPVPATVTHAVPKVSGVVNRTSYSAVVTDLQLLVEYVAQHPDQIGLLQPNQVALNALARALKTNARIPGVEVRETNGVAVGARA